MVYNNIGHLLEAKAEKDTNKVMEIEKKKEELIVKEQKADKLLEQLEQQKEEHKQIIEEQKEVLQKMKEHLEEDEASAAKKVIEPQVPKAKSNQSQGIGQQV